MTSHDPIYFALYKKASSDAPTLIDGTLRKLENGETSVYYYFDALPDGITDFNQVVVREVELTNTDLSPVPENGILELGGMPKGEEYQEGFPYKVNYTPGHPVGSAGNVRTDIVKNTRPGLRILKTDYSGQPLPGAVFTLTDSDHAPVGQDSFTSDEEGLITTAYLKQGEYTLTETASPKGYLAMEDPLKITVDEQNRLSVSGGTQGEFSFDDTTDPDAPVLTIKNRLMTLKVLKIDATAETTDEPLAGAHFELFRQLKQGDDVMIDYQPMAGYEDLVTESDGIVPKINEQLAPGTYYLREKSAPSRFAKLDQDIVFTIDKRGVVSIEDAAMKNWLHQETDSDTKGTVRNTIKVPNSFGTMEVTFVKIDNTDPTRKLSGAKFDLYKGTGENRQLLYGNLTSDDNGKLTYKDGATTRTIFQLPIGNYELVETQAPETYELLDQPVTVHIISGGISYDDGYSRSVSGEGISGSITDGFTLEISNSSGVELPSSGGPGTTWIYLLGAFLLFGCGVTLIARRRVRN